jgi:hypothetical protein
MGVWRESIHGWQNPQGGINKIGVVPWSCSCPVGHPSEINLFQTCAFILIKDGEKQRSQSNEREKVWSESPKSSGVVPIRITIGIAVRISIRIIAKLTVIIIVVLVTYGNE